MEKADNAAVCVAIFRLHWDENGQVFSFSLARPNLCMLIRNDALDSTLQKFDV